MTKKRYITPSCDSAQMVIENGLLAGSQSPWGDSKEVTPDVWDDDTPPTTERLWNAQRVNQQEIGEDIWEE